MNDLIARTARKALHRTFFHVAIVTKGGAVKAVGYNHGSIHAEVMALSKLWPNQRPGCKVWSIRVRKNGSYGLARPCDDCAEYLRTNGIRTAIYSNEDGKFVRERIGRVA